MSPHPHDDETSGFMASARSVAPVVMRQLRPLTILDVGCGAGAWVRAYEECGAVYVVGVDADCPPADQLLFNPSRFHTIDVAGVFRIGREFDLVQCLEVAEHVDPAASEALLDNLVAHAPLVLFSAAPPGQGGVNNVNERPYEFWRDGFQARGYALFDFLRPQLRFRRGVEHWYRYNMFLFAREDAVAGSSRPRGHARRPPRTGARPRAAVLAHAKACPLDTAPQRGDAPGVGEAPARLRRGRLGPVAAMRQQVIAFALIGAILAAFGQVSFKHGATVGSSCWTSPTCGSCSDWCCISRARSSGSWPCRWCP